MFWSIFKKKSAKDAEVHPVEYLESMQKLDVKDGDILILKHPGPLSAQAYTSLKNCIEDAIERFGFKVHVMILEEGMGIGVLRPKKGKPKQVLFGKPVVFTDVVNPAIVGDLKFGGPIR